MLNWPGFRDALFFVRLMTKTAVASVLAMIWFPYTVWWVFALLELFALPLA